MNTKLTFSLTQIEYVLALHRFGHFAKAAEHCFVTQPTLSMQIQKLENDLNIKLFDRSKKPILLTSAGKALIDQFKTILFEAKKIESLIAENEKSHSKGHLSLAVIPTIAPYIIPRLLPTLEAQFRDLELQIFEMQTHRIVEALENDETDVGLLAIPLNLTQIKETSLYYEPFFVLARKGHELTNRKKVKYSELKQNDIWLLTEGHCLRNQVLDLCSIPKTKGVSRQFHFESGSLETLKNLVTSYGGYTLLPQLATTEVNGNTQLIPFEKPVPAREVGLVYRRKHYKAELINSLRQAILLSIPDELKKIRPKDLEVMPVDEVK